MQRKKQNLCTKTGLLYSLLLYFAAVLLQLPSLTVSTYLRVIWMDLMLLFFIYGSMILLVYQFNGRLSSVLLTASAGVLAVGNLAQPLMYFACHQDDVAADTMRRLQHIAVLHLLCLAGGWVLIRLTEHLIKTACITETLLAAIASFGLAGYIFMRTGSDRNTSAAQNGFQPAILAAFAISLLLAAALGKQAVSSRRTHLALATLLAVLMVYKHELGIPILVIAACVLYYLLSYPSPHITVLLLICAGFCVLSAVVLAFNPDLLHDTVKKLIERPQLSDQISSAQRSLQAAGWFGRFSYDIKVAEASTDLALANAIHYWGYAWILVMAVPYVTGGVLLLWEEGHPHGFGFSVMLRGICFFVYTVFLCWNFGMSFQLLPLIGVQAPFSGCSGSFSVLSGMLLSSITICNPTRVKQFLKRGNLL